MATEQTAATKSDRIVDDLRRLILTGEIARGERLRQDALAERFSTSITPVREALRVLESEGLVTSEPHRGVRVTAIDTERVESIYVLRRLAEGHAMRRAAVRMTPLDLRAADDLAEQVDAASAAGDAAEARRLNRAFHFHFYERCGLQGLVDHIATLWTAFPWDLLLSSPDRAVASAEEHRAILDAVRRGDAAAAGQAAEAHIHHGFVAVMAHLGVTVAADPFLDDHA